MRKSRVLTLMFVVALSVTAPSFAKVCHPKQPVTCNAASFSRLAVSSTFAPAAAKPKATAVKTKAPAQMKQAMCCGPWSRWLCAVNTLG